MIEHVVGVTFSLDATLSDHSTWKQEGWLACSTITSIPILMHNHFWNSYLTTVWSHVECSSSVSDFLETVTSWLRQNVLKCVPILLFVTEIFTYSTTHFASNSASKIYQGLHTSYSFQVTTTKLCQL